jgi:DNA-binding response OmpR family regulator
LVVIHYLPENKQHGNSISANKVNNKIPKKKKILLVDDEPDITFSLKIGLEDKGFEVHTFNDAVLALSNFKAGVYDIALLDVKMPKMNGFELYEKIREIDSEAKVCFITAHEVYYESLKEIFPDMDCDCYVKPININDLVRCVKAQVST